MGLAAELVYQRRDQSVNSRLDLIEGAGEPIVTAVIRVVDVQIA
jgi:hypothetical protein